MRHGISMERNSRCVEIEESRKLLNVTCGVVTCKHYSLAIVSAYRSPSISQTDCLLELRSLVSQLLCLTKYIVLVGDLNFDILSNSRVVSDYINALSDFHFIQQIADATRVTNSSVTLIDHVITTPTLTVLQCYQAVGLSDHQCQILEVDVPTVRVPSHSLMIRSFRHCPWNEVRDFLCTAPWQVMDIYDSVDDMWSFVSSILHECLDAFAPVCSVQSRKSHRSTPWLTQSLLSAIKQKKQAKRKAQQTNSDEDVLLYRQLKNNLKCLVREAKINYVKTLISQARQNPQSAGELWRGVNDVLGCYQVRGSEMGFDLSLDSINDFFRTVATTADHQPASAFVPLGSGQSDSNFTFHAIPSSVVFSMLKNLDVKKSVGPDGISARFLKEIAAEITNPLTKLFNKSLETGVFPCEWKRSNVTPVFKSGSRDNPGYFRPISVVPVVAKILEKLVAQQLNAYFESHQLLSPHQCAYRQKRSTE